jgi:hypothetical protein
MEEQVSALRELAAQRKVSIASLVREGVERILADNTETEKWRRAAAVLGRFQGGPHDVSTNHDKYLAEDFL